MKERDSRARADYENYYAEWWRRFQHEGATSAYPYAWRLPERARPLGGIDSAHARLALAQTFFTLGRFVEARDSLAECSTLPAAEMAQAQGLRARCAILLGKDDVADPDATTLAGRAETMRLDLLRDRAEALLAALPAYRQAIVDDESESAWCDILACWASARLHHDFDQALALAALARLRHLAPANAAHAGAVLAEAAFHRQPCWSLVWLDEALAQCARYAQHHVELRLLCLKSCALEAAGQIGEATRFHALAEALARRQGASHRLERWRDQACAA